jgi:hypothetical protein
MFIIRHDRNRSHPQVKPSSGQTQINKLSLRPWNERELCPLANVRCEAEAVAAVLLRRQRICAGGVDGAEKSLRRVHTILSEACDSPTAIYLFKTKRLLRFGKHRKWKKKLQKAQQMAVLFKQSSNSPRSSIGL